MLKRKKEVISLGREENIAVKALCWYLGALDERKEKGPEGQGQGRRKVVEALKMDSSVSAVISLHYPINPRTKG